MSQQFLFRSLAAVAATVLLAGPAHAVAIDVVPVGNAAHASVQRIHTPAPYPASAVVTSTQGRRKDGGEVRVQRSNPQAALELETGQNESNFFSLGFGGSIVVEFGCPIRNGEGNDVQVVEDTWGPTPAAETADVYASEDGTNWVFLGTADNNFGEGGKQHYNDFDLGELFQANYIRVVDTTNPEPFAGWADAFDVNAVRSLQDCIRGETAFFLEFFDTAVEEGRLEGIGPVGPISLWIMRYLLSTADYFYDQEVPEVTLVFLVYVYFCCDGQPLPMADQLSGEAAPELANMILEFIVTLLP